MRTAATLSAVLLVAAGYYPGAPPPSENPEPSTITRPAPSDRETKWSAWIAQEYHGKAEARTLDGSRVDVLTDSDAWEVEWSSKWKEAPGQAILYGAMTDRRPGVLLLLKGEPNDEKNALRCAIVCAQAGVRLRFIDCETGLRR